MVNSLGLVCCPLSPCCCCCCCNYKRYCCCLWFIVWSRQAGSQAGLSRFGFFRLLFLLNLHFAHRSSGGCVVHLEWAWCEFCLEAMLGYDMPLKWFDTRQRFEWSQLASSRRGTVQCPQPHCSSKCFLSKQLGTRHSVTPSTERVREIQQPSISALTAPSSVYSNARAVIFGWMRVQKVNQFVAHKSRTRARRKLQFIVATSGNRATAPARSLWLSQSSLLCLYSADILTFLLKMLANKGHILCMPLVKSNGATVHAKLPLESG